MIDWHSHILPAMDDGSRDPDESIAMLRELARQGVDTVAATPHFYANDESPTQFLARRTRALEQLYWRTDATIPRILPGAEVRYYAGIASRDDLRSLCIGETGLLLVEMPEIRWTTSTVQELLELSDIHGIFPVLAHIERYLHLQHADVWAQLLDSGIRMQVNASYFLEWRTRRKAMSMLTEGSIHFLGSDCHNLTTRPPRIGEAYARIARKLGTEYVAQMDAYGRAMLTE
ncbi:MAG: hypothetical protein IJY28_03485 [Clostridia bacterium]|nr:hypothetical protein [Clostridia bacterium]